MNIFKPLNYKMDVLDEDSVYYICQQMDIPTLYNFIQTKKGYRDMCLNLLVDKIITETSELRVLDNQIGYGISSRKSQGHKPSTFKELKMERKDIHARIDENYGVAKLLFPDLVMTGSDLAPKLLQKFPRDDMVLDVLAKTVGVDLPAYHYLLDIVKKSGYEYEVGMEISEGHIPVPYNDLIDTFIEDPNVQMLKEVVEGTLEKSYHYQGHLMLDYLLDNFSIQELVDMIKRNRNTFRLFQEPDVLRSLIRKENPDSIVAQIFD